MANRRTLESVVPEAERWPADRTNPVYEHLGGWWNNARSVIDWFGGDAFRAELEAHDPDARLDVLRRCSQFLQADGLRYAVESSRRRWPRSAGTLPWQLNESFPNAWCTAAVDYHGRPKPAYWAVAEAYAPVVVGAVLERQALAGAASLAAVPWALSEDGRIAGRLMLRVYTADGSQVAQDEQRIDGSDSVSGKPVDFSLTKAEPDGEARFLLLDVALLDDADARLAERRYLLDRGPDLRSFRAVAATRLETWHAIDALIVRNAGPRIAIGVEVVDGRPVGAAGWVDIRPGWFHLLPGEQRAVSEHPYGDEHAAELLVVSAWNASAIRM